MALVTFRDVNLRFRGPLLLDRASLTIESGERIGLLGRNGAGKSTLMRLIQSELEPDSGEIARQQGLSIAMLPQDVPVDLTGSVFDEVARGLGHHAALLADYHRLSHAMAIEPSPELHARLYRAQHQLEAQGAWSVHQQVETMLSRMQLDADAEVPVLSAGMKRRVLLAKALVSQPDLLLLDEPTNHLDLEAIRWLEEFFARCSGTLLFVTHDRAFLRKIATRILELDRGKLTSWACDYGTYLDRKEAALAAEAGQWADFDKKLAQEEIWIRTGIKARRTRNMGRVRALEAMRDQRRQRRQRPGQYRVELQEAERSGRLVIEAKQIGFGYDGRAVIRDFSTLVMRGDRIGILGPNGSGKTTLLRLLLGELSPQQGAVRHGTNLEVAYFDQLHAELDETASVRANVRDGSDWVSINGKRRHVLGYLGDFLFSPEQADAPIAQLSGGERNRLLLARLFTKPSNVLVMDEPTNDLDLETLELLEDLLAEYPGTLLLVSHDREFLNNVVTSTLALEGDGMVKEYAGGYDDYLVQRGTAATVADEPARAKPKPPPAAKERPKRLSYKEQRELETLPARIEALESEQAELHRTMADPAFYKQDPASISQIANRLKRLEEELSRSYARWQQLEETDG